MGDSPRLRYFQVRVRTAEVRLRQSLRRGSTDDSSAPRPCFALRLRFDLLRPVDWGARLVLRRERHRHRSLRHRTRAEKPFLSSLPQSLRSERHSLRSVRLFPRRDVLWVEWERVSSMKSPLLVSSGGLVSIGDAPRKDNEGLPAVTASPPNSTASFLETIAAPTRIEAGPIDVTAALMKIMASPARAPSKYRSIPFDRGSLR